jgi:hypothetical protein
MYQSDQKINPTINQNTAKTISQWDSMEGKQYSGKNWEK